MRHSKHILHPLSFIICCWDHPQEIAPEPAPPLKSEEPYLPSDLGQLPDQNSLAVLPPILQQQHDVSMLVYLEVQGVDYSACMGITNSVALILCV